MRRWLIGWLGWTIVALFLSLQGLIRPAVNLEADLWPILVMHYVLVFYVWGLLSIPILAITRRVGMHRERWLRSILFYLLVGIGFALVHYVITNLVLTLVLLATRGTTGHAINALNILASLQSDLIIYVVITSVCLASSYYRKYQERELRASKLEAQLTQARLAALQSQLRPHFLFNTLNAIAALVREQPDAAERMIVRLSELLRSTLDDSGREEITLREELSLAEQYLEIERVRFGERLQVERHVDSSTLKALVPSWILQPLIENAVQHGVAATSAPCRVRLDCRRQDDLLVMEVADDGPGRANPKHEGKGLGLRATRDRLFHVYDGAASCDASAHENGSGFVVTITLPFRDRSVRE